ncbi:hypothetical protein CIB48_g5361 [Xylaria polymorpha]|nr:hypothetical protein CIB48_g5361 [Xylaria polymorpha]
MASQDDSFRIANDEEEARMKAAAEASKRRREEARRLFVIVVPRFGVYLVGQAEPSLSKSGVYAKPNPLASAESGKTYNLPTLPT